MLDERRFLRERDNRHYPNLRGKRVLIVEDDPVIAVDYHFQLKDVGATAEGFKATNRDALTYLASHEVDAAIVDFLLCDGTGESIIDDLKTRGIPFIVDICAFAVGASRAISSSVSLLTTRNVARSTTRATSSRQITSSRRIAS